MGRPFQHDLLTWTIAVVMSVGGVILVRTATWHRRPFAAAEVVRRLTVPPLHNASFKRAPPGAAGMAIHARDPCVLELFIAGQIGERGPFRSRQLGAGEVVHLWWSASFPAPRRRGIRPRRRAVPPSRAEEGRTQGVSIRLTFAYEDDSASSYTDTDYMRPRRFAKAVRYYQPPTEPTPLPVGVALELVTAVAGDLDTPGLGITPETPRNRVRPDPGSVRPPQAIQVLRLYLKVRAPTKR